MLRLIIFAKNYRKHVIIRIREVLITLPVSGIEMSNLPEVPTDDLLSFHDYNASQTSPIDAHTYAPNNENNKDNESFDIDVTPENAEDLDKGTNFM